MILFFGKHGQLARSFQATEPKKYMGQTVYLSSHEAKFERPDLLPGILDKYGPEIVVICAAYTLVDKAEEEKELAELINADAPREIARWCSQNGAFLIHFSTDYVYSGEGQVPWKETDPTAPLNWYGETKLQGENAIRDSGCRHWIFRTSWVISEYGKNFVRTMLRLGKDKESLRVVDDQVGAPTYAPDLAATIWGLISRLNSDEKMPIGTYHLTGQGETTWAGLARAIFEEARQRKMDLSIQRVDGIPTSEYPTTAVRPQNSRLDQTKAKEKLGVQMPDWRDSLKVCLQRMG